VKVTGTLRREGAGLIAVLVHDGAGVPRVFAVRSELHVRNRG
jgi:hypothetical protein